ncbi:hypothetical protein HZB04_03575 [Candidatus Wolfebacteria bacterium]|nr:hypothetical protein [Candidatus Wolfebacteria bacterium]
MKKILFVLFILIIIIGVVIFVVFRFKTEKIINPQDFSKYGIQSEIAKKEIEKLVSPEPNKNIFGSILRISNQDKKFTLQVYIENQLDSSKSKIVPLDITIDPADEFYQDKLLPSGFGQKKMTTVKAVFNDLKIKDFIGIEFKKDKKIIHLPALF